MNQARGNELERQRWNRRPTGGIACLTTSAVIEECRQHEWGLVPDRYPDGIESFFMPHTSTLILSVRNKRAQFGKDHFTPLGSVHSMKERRERLLVIVDDWDGQITVTTQSLFQRLNRVVIAPDKEISATWAGITVPAAVQGGGKSRAAGQAGDAVKDSAAYFLIPQLQQYDEIKGSLHSLKFLVEMTRLSHRAGKAVEKKPCSVSGDPRRDDTHSKLIGHKKPPASPGIRLQPKGSSPCALGAQECPRRDVRNSERLGQAVRLCPFAGSRRAEQDNPPLLRIHGGISDG